MTKKEYDELQERMTRKLKDRKHSTNKEEAYNEGIFVCKSILKDFFELEYRKGDYDE